MEETKSLLKIHSKRKAAEIFSLSELFEFAMERNLEDWLADNFYTSESLKLSRAIKKRGKRRRVEALDLQAVRVVA